MKQIGEIEFMNFCKHFMFTCRKLQKNYAWFSWFC